MPVPCDTNAPEYMLTIEMLFTAPVNLGCQYASSIDLRHWIAMTAVEIPT
jgi:hypothetical protein